jgi:hypothetical protein
MQPEPFNQFMGHGLISNLTYIRQQCRLGVLYYYYDFKTIIKHIDLQRFFITLTATPLQIETENQGEDNGQDPTVDQSSTDPDH